MAPIINILNNICTVTWIFIQGGMRPYGGRLCTTIINYEEENVALSETPNYWLFASHHPNHAIADSGRRSTSKPAQGTAYM